MKTASAGRGVLAPDPQALIAEARERQRVRRRHVTRVTLSTALIIGACTAGIVAQTDHGRVTPEQWSPGPVRPMPSQVVVWTDWFRIEVVSARTGLVLRTLATNVALFQGIPTIAVSPDTVYFDEARGHQEWIVSTPLTGGPITPIAEGSMPAVSPNGRLLAYVAYPAVSYPPDTPARDRQPKPEAIIVRNVDTGIARRWAFTSAVPDIMSLSWSPDNRFLSYTSSDWTGRLPPAETTQILDTWSAGTLTSAPRVPLAPGAEWAGFLTTRIGLAVAPDPAAQHRLSLVAVSIRSGRIVRGLTRLPVQGLSTDNAYDGTEGTITADASGHYVLIAVNGPDGHGEILRWTFGSGHLALVTGGASRAAWG